ncbi:uncharacterized protein LOC120118241 [Hibiscus syriacus]|uniref:uncharacterized protein LOC120118241 n=1 Tax=Hibiscus syriacus TaxID=106335 RepID=UPI0019223BA4|nr:uncharacterized protein LOC120118241 [Hibiscus syriacus]
MRRLEMLRVDVICFMETRVKNANFSMIIALLAVEWNCATNYDFSNGGRLWVLWKKDLPFTVLKSSDQALSIVGDVASHSLVITTVYGSNSGLDRRDLWEHLKTLKADIGHSSWIIGGGDFNIISNAQESSDFGNLGLHSTPDMEDFKSCLVDLELLDHHFSGPLYTWSNKQDDLFLAHKLDKILINSQWLLEFPDSAVEFQAQGVSDHCPVIIWTQKSAQVHRPKPFKFFNCWTAHEGFLRVVNDSWQEQSVGNAMQVLFNKMKMLKPLLRERLSEEKRIQADLIVLEAAESDFYKQKAKAHWLQEGDLNTRFFHQRVEANKKMNTIRIIKDEYGVFYESFDDMASELVKFYKNLIGTADPLVKGCPVESLKLLLKFSLPDGAADSLVGRVTDKEIKEALFRQVSWEIVSKDFLEAIRWIKACVTTPRYSIALNGTLVGYFEGARGSGVVSILEKFYELSGIRLNAMKSELFACGLPMNILEQIQYATNFKIGQLPVRYLGVPLVTRKLSSNDCSALLVRIKNRIDQWASRKLSFGGRLQLVKSVLFNIFGYCSRQIVLPKGVISDIEKLCMRFFWKGCDIPARGARVSWNQICALKSEGELSLRKISDWSKACCLMLVKNILADEGSLWISWIKVYCFKSVDYWNVNSKPHFSWILKLRDKARSLFNPVAIWPQIKGSWIWNNIRARIDKVGGISSYGNDNVCGLCYGNLKSRNHLFFECSFASEIWNAILRECDLQPQALNSWDEALCWLTSTMKGKSLLVHILKLA